MGAQRRCDLGRPAEPCFEAGPGLMQQQAKTINHRIAAPGRRCQQRRFQRGVDDIVDHCFSRQGRKIKVERVLADHAQDRGVDYQSGARKGRAAVVP